MKIRLVVLLALISASVKGQVSTSAFSFYGYLDAYFGYDLGKPANGNRPSFIYNHSQHNQVNVNLVFLKIAYAGKRFRFNAAPMLGTYSQANLSGEPFYLRQIFEANFGVKLSKNKELWLDAGVFPSHIGFESAISKDCPTLSRSLLAENSPYFETGVKLTYQHKQNLTISALVLNGWQRIYWSRDKAVPSFGTQIYYQPNSKVVLNYSTFFGNNYSWTERKFRSFHNLYAIYSPIERLSLTLGFDIGAEQKSTRSTAYNVWFSPVIIARYQPLKQLSLAARYEFFSDRGGAIIAYQNTNGFSTHGFSINLDYLISDKVMWRCEARMLKSKEAIYEWRGNQNSLNTHFLTSLAILLRK